MSRFAIIEGGTVVIVVEAEAAFAETQGWIAEQDASIGWLWDGESFSAPVKPDEVIQQEIIEQTQQRLDDFAKTREYDGILSLCTYATSTVPKFLAEGQYGVESRDATWAKLYEILDEVLAGTRPMPSGYTDIEPELPVLAWPV
jgi:hypothetical protein